MTLLLRIPHGLFYCLLRSVPSPLLTFPDFGRHSHNIQYFLLNRRRELLQQWRVLRRHVFSGLELCDASVELLEVVFEEGLVDLF